MKRRLLPALAAAVLTVPGLSGCNLLEGINQAQGGDRPVPFSTPWHEERAARKEEARRIKDRQALEAWAGYLASQPDPNQPAADALQLLTTPAVAD